MTRGELKRHIGWYVLAAVCCLQAGFAAASGAWAATQSIDGDPLDIFVDDTGTMALWYQGVYQYYGEDSWGSVLMFDVGDGIPVTEKYGSSYQVGYGATAFTPVGNTKPNTWRIVTVMDAGDSGVTVTQTVDYTNGQSYYKMTWTITNDSGVTYTNCKFFHGGDTYFGGDDAARSYWNEALGMIYLRNPGVSGIMGFYGGVGSRADRYYGGYYDDGNEYAVNVGDLPNEADPDYIDAGYYLQWNRASLEPGQSWVITAYEKWTEAGNVQVIAPSDETRNAGEVVDLNFIIQNFQEDTDTFTLHAASDLGWPVSLPGGDTVSVDSGEVATVLVRVRVPSSAVGLIDTVTLTATSQTDEDVTNADSVQITCEGIAEEEEDEDNYEDYYNLAHDKEDRILGIKCFIETASAQGGALAPVLMGLLCAVFARMSFRKDK